MVLVRLKSVSLAFGNQVLLNKVDLDVNAGERVCVLGRNGEGKSTLLKILNKEITPDEGSVQHNDTVKIAALQQELPVTDPQSVYEELLLVWVSWVRRFLNTMKKFSKVSMLTLCV